MLCYIAIVCFYKRGFRYMYTIQEVKEKSREKKKNKKINGYVYIYSRNIYKRNYIGSLFSFIYSSFLNLYC